MSEASSAVRVPSGISALDSALEGGLPSGRVSLITGDVGAGKTTFALQFLAEGVRVGEPGIFIALDQKPEHLAQTAAQFGWSVDRDDEPSIMLLDGSPALALIRNQRTTLDARAVISDLTPHLRARGARRLVIDAIPSLVPPGFSEWEEEEFLRSLVFALEDNLGCTSLWIASGEDPRSARVGAVAARLVSGVIDLRVRESGGRLHRHVLVRKMRGVNVDAVERPYEFGPEGLVMFR